MPDNNHTKRQAGEESNTRAIEEEEVGDDSAEPGPRNKEFWNISRGMFPAIPWDSEIEKQHQHNARQEPTESV